MKKLIAYIVVFILLNIMIVGLITVIFGEGYSQRFLGLVAAIACWYPAYKIAGKYFGRNKAIETDS